jgi:hypothetical protein
MGLRRVSLSGARYAPCGTGHTVAVVGHRLTVLGPQLSVRGGRPVSGFGAAQRGQDGLATQGRDALATAAGLHRCQFSVGNRRESAFICGLTSVASLRFPVVGSWLRPAALRLPLPAPDPSRGQALCGNDNAALAMTCCRASLALV